MWTCTFRRVTRTIENTAAADVKLSEAESKAVWDLIEAHEVKGTRYVDELDQKAVLHLWG